MVASIIQYTVHIMAKCLQILETEPTMHRVIERIYNCLDKNFKSDSKDTQTKYWKQSSYFSEYGTQFYPQK